MFMASRLIATPLDGLSLEYLPVKSNAGGRGFDSQAYIFVCVIDSIFFSVSEQSREVHLVITYA